MSRKISRVIERLVNQLNSSINTKIEVSDVLNIRNKIISHPKVITPEKEEDKNEHRQVSPQPPKVSSKLLYKKKGKTDAKVN